MTNSARRNAAVGNAKEDSAMPIATENRRPAWFQWVAGLPVVVALLFASGCGATIRNDGAPITNPLNDRTPAARPTSRPPEQGSLLADPEPAGPGGATDAEGAAVRALELVAEGLAVPSRELRAESVVARPDRKSVV